MFLGEMLMGIDLEGDEPGEVSKCMVKVALGVGPGCVYTGSRGGSAVKRFLLPKRVGVCPRRS